MSRFSIGQKVVCIADMPHLPTIVSERIIRGEIYVVAGHGNPCCGKGKGIYLSKINIIRDIPMTCKFCGTSIKAGDPVVCKEECFAPLEDMEDEMEEIVKMAKEILEPLTV